MKDKDLSSDIPATVWPVLLFGIVMPVGAILKWKWVLQMQGSCSLVSLFVWAPLGGKRGLGGRILLIIIICVFDVIII